MDTALHPEQHMVEGVQKPHTLKFALVPVETRVAVQLVTD